MRYYGQNFCVKTNGRESLYLFLWYLSRKLFKDKSNNYSVKQNFVSGQVF